MQDLAALQTFAIPSALSFRIGPGGLAYADLRGDGGSASLCLQGAHLTSFRPDDQDQPLIWLSEAARFAPGRSIRGGIPVCWPWFGAHRERADFPAHGFARSLPWDVVGSGSGGGTTWMRLRLRADAIPAAQWPHATPVELRVEVGNELALELLTHNASTEPVELSEALHSYFHVGDIARVGLQGLDGCEYLDKTLDFASARQQGALAFRAETDRVYLDTRASCRIDDPVLGRGIRIDKQGSLSTVVWTPWQQRAAAMGDFSATGWRQMLCVESANAAANRLLLAPGEKHRLAVRYAAVAL
jgi:D-hexose-6-phosphate mutarotase